MEFEMMYTENYKNYEVFSTEYCGKAGIWSIISTRLINNNTSERARQYIILHFHS